MVALSLETPPYQHTFYTRGNWHIGKFSDINNISIYNRNQLKINGNELFYKSLLVSANGDY